MYKLKSRALTAVTVVAMMISAVPVRATEIVTDTDAKTKVTQPADRVKNQQTVQTRMENLKEIKYKRAEFNTIIEQNADLRKIIANNRKLIKQEIQRIAAAKLAIPAETLTEAQELVGKVTAELTAMKNTSGELLEIQSDIEEDMTNRDVDKVTSAVGMATTVAKERNAKLTDLSNTIQTLLILVQGVK